MSQNIHKAAILSIVYATFVIFFPWDEISRGGFTDFNQYVNSFDYYHYLKITFKEIYQIPDDIYPLELLKEYFTKEFLWFELVSTITEMVGDAGTALRIISFFILIIWGFYSFRNLNFSLALIFLFNPFAIDVAMSGVRNGLAWALVILSLMVNSKKIKVSLFLFGIFIHSTVLVLAIFYFCTNFIFKNLSGKKLLFIGLGLGTILGLGLTIGGELILGAIGDRRIGNNYVVGGGSLLQASIWIMLIIFQSLSGREYIKQNIFPITIIAWYVVLNPFIPWAYRVWAASLPIIGVSANRLPNEKRKIFILFYIIYLIAQYLYWTKIFYYWY